MEERKYLDSIMEKKKKYGIVHYDDFTEEELKTLPPCTLGKHSAYFDFVKHEWGCDYTYWE